MSDGRKHTIFETGGKVYNLRVSYNAMCMFTETIGPLTDLQNKPLPAYRGLLWASINAFGAQSVTVEQAGDLCEEYITEKGLKAFQETMKGILESSGWMTSGGTDTGNQNAAPRKRSPKPSQSTNALLTDSEISPPASSTT